jgi:hypothetical protein
MDRGNSKSPSSYRKSKGGGVMEETPDEIEWVVDVPGEMRFVIDTSAGSSVFGRLLRVLTFLPRFVLTGRASL